MRPLGIRARVLLAAMLPVTIVAVLLAIVFMVMVVNDLDSAHSQRARALARQIASTSEFALFTGNRPALEALLNASMREADVRALAVLDRSGETIVRTGYPLIDVAPLPSRHDETREFTLEMRRLVVQPIMASELPVDRLFEHGGARGAPQPNVMGFIALELTRESLVENERTLIVVGTLVTLGGLLFGCLLAIRLSRSVTAPVLQVIDVVDRFGQGDVAARVQVDSAGPLQALEEGINRMATRIAQHRDELERRVEEATSELRAKKDEAERANTAKSRFLAAASHDLRQPIHALRLFVGNLRHEIAGQPRAEAVLERVEKSIDATSEMFDALLDISRLEAGVIRKNVQDFPVQSLLQRLEMVFSPVALEHRLRFSIVPSQVWIRSDPVLLDRVLQNLVGNAMKYTVSGGVLVGCRRHGERVSIQVWDTGPGIPAEHREEIFQEFFQLHNPARDSSKGLGLGLAIVQRLATLLDHPVRLESIPGRGSMFALDVPRADARRVLPGAPAVSMAIAGFPGLSVGVVDDDAVIREAMSGLLARWGCSVVAAASGRTLIDELRGTGRSIDLLICDYRLGRDESGLDVIGALRIAVGRPVPALLITGDTAPERLKEAHDSGYQVLHKPVAPARLRQAIASLVLPRGTLPESRDRPR